MLAALVNSVVLIVIVIAIAIEAVHRLENPVPVQGGLVMISALVAIAVNALVVLGLSGHDKNLNMRAALLHVTGDIGASVGVVVAGAVILITGWLYIDPILSLGIAALIAFGAWRIVRETVNLLLEGTPREIVVLNAGVALYAANVAGSIADGIDRARAVVASGAAQKKLEQFVATTRKLAGSAP